MGKIYVVFIGRKPGVYDNWIDAQAQVNKFSGASHQSYHDRREVVEAFDAFMDKQAASSTVTDENWSSSSSTSRQDDKASRLKNARLELEYENRRHASKISEICEKLQKISDSM